MDDVRYLDHHLRRQRFARHEVATILTRHRAERIRQALDDLGTGPLPSLRDMALSAADAIYDFAVTAQVEFMWERA